VMTDVMIDVTTVVVDMKNQVMVTLVRHQVATDMMMTGMLVVNYS